MAKKINVFKKIAESSSDNPPYQKGTRCIERIDRIKMGINREENFYIAFEKTVLHVTSDAKGVPYGDRDYGGDLVGDCVSHVFSMSGKNQKDYTMRELRQFLKNVVQVSEADLNDPDKVNDLVLQICGVEGTDENDEGNTIIVTNGEQPLQNVFIERHDYVKAGKKEVEEGKKPMEFTNTRYTRAVPPSEVMELLNEETIDRLFPDGLLERLVQEEQEEDED